MTTGVAGAPTTIRRPGALVAVSVLAAFTANFDLQIVNLALPVIGEAFDVSQSTLAWAVNAYVLPFAVSILAVGRLGDRFGLRPVLTIGGLLFAVGAALSALAPAYGVLLAGRVVQGIGGAALLTIGLASISASFEGPARGRALGLYFAAGATAAVIGPLVGGVLTSLVGWPGMFWVAGAARRRDGRRRVGDPPAGGRREAAARWTRRPSRWARSCCSGSTGRSCRPTPGAGCPLGVVGGFAVAVIALVAFVWRERTTPEPAVRLEILRSRAFVVSTLVGAAAWFGILSGSVQLAVYLQEVRGLTPTETALVLLPWPLLAALIFPRGAAIVARFGAPRMMVLSLAFALAAAVLMLAFDPTTPLLVVSAVAALGGVPMSLGVVASTMTALSEFAPADAGIAAGRLQLAAPGRLGARGRDPRRRLRPRRRERRDRPHAGVARRVPQPGGRVRAVPAGGPAPAPPAARRAGDGRRRPAARPAGEPLDSAA